MSKKIKWALETRESMEATGTLPFSVWRRAEGYKSRENFYDYMVCSGCNEEEIDDAWDVIESEYSDYCDENDMDEDMDE